MDILHKAGADPSRVIIGHIDRTITNYDTLIELSHTGCYLEFDLFGWETSNYSLSEVDMPNDGQRMDFIKRLIDNNLISRLVLAQDICTKNRTTKYGGHGYHHILENIVPRMLKRGITENEINTMLVENPATLLTLS
tara:strand:- start:266 stop:676 length:411 start_codon:yes stop_codon:yes gene_type:complete